MFALAGIVLVTGLAVGLALGVIRWAANADETAAGAYLDRTLRLEHARSALEEESANARAYLLTGVDASLAATARDRDDFNADLVELRASAIDRNDRDLMDRTERRSAVYGASVARVLGLRQTTAPEAEIRTTFETDVVPAKAELDTTLIAASARAQHEVMRAHEAAAATRARVIAGVGSAALALLALAIALALFLRRAARQLVAERVRLSETLARVEQSNEDLDAFAGRVAHDLRNALAPTLLVSGLIRTSVGSPDRIASLCDRLDRANRRAQTLLDSLLAFARAKQSTPEPEAASVARVVAEVLEQLEPEAAQGDVHIQASAADARVACPPGLLHVVLANVLGNAIKFVRGRDERSVRLSSAFVRGGYSLRIDDTGPGVPDAARERIFEPFFRVPGTKQPGAGIGLATVRRILEAHGGRITVEAADGAGSSFLLWLPLATVQPGD